jgi:hypothetical protein
MGGAAALLKKQSLHNDPFETGKTGYVRVSNGYKGNNVKQILGEIHEGKGDYFKKDESECRHRYNLNTSYANVEGREKKGMYSQYADPDELKKARPAQMNPTLKRRNLWFMHNEEENVID